MWLLSPLPDSSSPSTSSASAPGTQGSISASSWLSTAERLADLIKRRQATREQCRLASTLERSVTLSGRRVPLRSWRSAFGREPYRSLLSGLTCDPFVASRGVPWRRAVQCVVAGYPCQPFSFAGRRLGVHDPRHLWPSVARIIAEIEPGVVFLENVAGHISLGFPDVRRELEAMGYRVTAGLFTAEEVGAPHERARLFILAVADGDRGRLPLEWDGELDADLNGCDGAGRYVAHRDRGLRSTERLLRARQSDFVGRVEELADARHGLLAQRPREEGRLESERPPVGGEPRGDRGELADAGGERLQGVGGAWPEAWPTRRGDGAALEHSGRDGRGPRVEGPRVEGPRAQRRTAARRSSGTDVPLFPPLPGDVRSWRRVLKARPDLAPAVEPGVRGVADGLAGRVDRLRGCGNGVVPLVAAYAFSTLTACLCEEVNP